MNTEVEIDEFHGRGGAYIVENGVKRCVEEPTKDHPEGNCPRDKDGKPIEFAKPAEKKHAKAAAPAAAAPAAPKGGSR